MLAGAGTTTWNYETDTGYLGSKLYDDGKGTSYTYTNAGRPQTRTLARGLHRVFTYENAGQLQNVAYFTDNTEATVDTTTPPVGYTYDRVGNLATLTDAAGAHTYTVTPTGRNELETIAGGLLDGTTLNPGYDALLRRESLGFNALGAQSLTHSYRYDTAGRYGTIAAGADPATSPGAAYTYHANSNLPDTTTSTGAAGGTKLTLSRSFDGINRLTNISNVSTGATDPLDHSYTFDHNTAGQRQRITLADGGYWDYLYDDLGQLENATKHLADGTPVASQTFAFSYDAIGNRLTSSRSGGVSPPTTTYTPNPLNQYTEIQTPGQTWTTGTADANSTVTVDSQPATRPGTAEYFEHLGTVDNTNAPVFAKHLVEATNPDGEQDRTARFARVPQAVVTPTHDDDGNLLTDAFYTYIWNGENRLIAIETLANLPPEFPQHRLEFTYDALGRRIEKKVYGLVEGSWQLARHKRFLYDGWNLLAEYEPKTTGVWQVTSSYLWGTDLSGTLQGAGGTSGLLHLRDHQEDAGYFVAYDGKGNVSALVDDQTGDTAATYQYTPFGQTLTATGPAAHLNPFRFSTRYLDVETGLYYYGFRYYSPNTGRWINRDPIGERGGVNLSGFVNNVPVGAIDRLGLISVGFFDPNDFGNTLANSTHFTAAANRDNHLAFPVTSFEETVRILEQLRFVFRLEIDRVSLYDHGIPGLQEVGNDRIEDPFGNENSASLLRRFGNTLSDSATVNYFGCNTADGQSTDFTRDPFEPADRGGFEDIPSARLLRIATLLGCPLTAGRGLCNYDINGAII